LIVQSQFWVLRWACRHCYDNRFRPYLRGEPDSVVKEGVRACETVIENLPADLSWTDADGTRKPTTIILAGGELLLDAVRKPLFFPVLATLQAKYSSAPQLPFRPPAILDNCLERGVSNIAIASIDDYHVGFEGEINLPLWITSAP
jgi:hypothetical protein